MDSPIVEWALFGCGILLIIAGIVLAPLPGPGGIFLIAPGLALILKTSRWAKRHYVRLKPKRVKIRGRHFVFGEWADWALRRPSAKRRKALAEAKNCGTSN